MNILDKIYANIVDQLHLSDVMRKAQDDFREAENKRNIVIGRMDILKELYNDDTGKDLEKEINTNPEFAELIKRAQEEAAGRNSNIEQNVAVEEKVSQTVPEINRIKQPVNVDRTIVIEEQNSEVPAQQRTDLNNRENPIAYSVDDNPPEPPSE